MTEMINDSDDQRPAGTTLMRIDDLEIWVDAVPVPGAEPPGIRPGNPAGTLIDAFDAAQAAILALGRRASATARELTTELLDTEPEPSAQNQDQDPNGAVSPTPPSNSTTGFEMEFGLAITASGNVILVGTEATASLKVKLWHHRS